jgi:hypothetical protein
LVKCYDEIKTEKLNAWKSQGSVKLYGHETPVRAELRLWAWRDHEVREEQLSGQKDCLLAYFSGTRHPQV